ncbi:hypothetical protein MNV49_005577 [Pseudohyphozyma bogoriensis]|nr:hypothetical protein MNV49_005577 [Pseudohyphozyma bogoriensis]
MDPSSLSKHLMLSDPHFARELDQHRRSSSTTSSASISSSTSSAFGYSAFPDVVNPATTTFLPLNGSAEYHSPQTYAGPYQHHFRHSSQDSSNSLDYSNNGGKAPKRALSIRRSRADSSPYPPHGVHDSDGRYIDYGLHGDSGSESASDWGELSRRSSMSSSGWSSYDPTFSEGHNPSIFEDQPFAQLDSFFPPAQPGHVGVVPAASTRGAEDAKKIEEIKDALTKLSDTAKSATTTSAQDRARGALGLSYGRYSEGNVSRQGLYGSYLKSCATYGVKAIKYHYCGIRPSNSEEATTLALMVKEESGSSTTEEKGDGDSPAAGSPPLEPKLEDGAALPSARLLQTFATEGQPATPTTARPTNLDASINSHDRRYPSRTLSISVPKDISVNGEPTLGGGRTATADSLMVAPPPSRVSQLVGFPSVGEVLGVDLSGGSAVDEEVARKVWESFGEHCGKLVESVRNYRFDQFEIHMRNWWSSLTYQQKDVVQHPTISQLIYRADAVVYGAVLEFLHSQVLVDLPPQTFASLRGLADNMERIKSISLAGFDGTSFPGPAIELSARFGHLLTRHLGLCQLSQALNGIVSNRSTLLEMAGAWDSIDFDAIKNQCALVSHCEHDLLTECFAGVKQLLVNPGTNPIESFIRWADQCFEKCGAFSSMDGARTTSPRSLLVRWTFVTSQIMRDLTLRSAPTFGSFAICAAVLRKVALQPSAIASVHIPSSSPVGLIIPPQTPFIPTTQSASANLAASFGLPNAALPPAPFYPVDSFIKTSMGALSGYNLAGDVDVHFTTTHEVTYPANFALASPSALFMSEPHAGDPMGYQLDQGEYGLAPASTTHLPLEEAVQSRFGDLRFDSASPAGSPSDNALTPASS